MTDHHHHRQQEESNPSSSFNTELRIPEWTCEVIDHVARSKGLRHEQACKLLILQGARVYREKIENHHE